MARKTKRNILNMIFVLGAFLSFYLGEILTFTTTQKVSVGIIFLLFLFVIVLRSPKTAQERLEEEDERNQYITMKCSAEALTVLRHSLVPTAAGILICFGLTRESLFIWMLAGAAIPYSVMKIAGVIFAFRYDK